MDNHDDNKKKKRGHPSYDAEEKFYAELYKIPVTTDKKINNGLQDIKKTKNNEDVVAMIDKQNKGHNVKKESLGPNTRR